MRNDDQEITIEISSELLEKVRFVANRHGMTTEQLIANLMREYVEENKHRIGG